MKKQPVTSQNWQNHLFQKTASNSGFLLIHKPVGPTSHDIINYLRRITKIQKIGHAGTLDPFASGLLIIAIGKPSTKKIQQFVGLDKVYQVKLKLGAKSNTFDCTGIIEIKKDAQVPTLFQIQKILKKFLGPQDQVPPMFSAKKIQGQKLYELARKGLIVKRKPHKIKIDYIKLLKYRWPLLTLKIKCSSGTYIRALVNDIGQLLDCGAYAEELKRVKIGKHDLKKAYTPERISPRPSRRAGQFVK